MESKEVESSPSSLDIFRMACLGTLVRLAHLRRRLVVHEPEKLECAQNEVAPVYSRKKLCVYMCI